MTRAKRREEVISVQSVAKKNEAKLQIIIPKAIKVKSFTLSELLIVMIITAIVIGMAFSVLRLVQKQIHTIKTNYDKSSTLALFEQKLWQDSYEMNNVQFVRANNTLQMQSETDTVSYTFGVEYTLRNKDTIKLKLAISKLYFEGKETKEGLIDAIAVSGEAELPEYKIFVSKKNDITLFMNQDNGF